MDYATYVTRLTTLLAVQSSSETNFQNILPAIIEYAENRCYRDLDLLDTTVTYSGTACTPNTSSITIPAGTLVTVQIINMITPSGTTSPESGTRNPCTPVSKEFLVNLYQGASGAALPQYFAMLDADTIVLGPWPDKAYTAEIVGTFRPTPLSGSNTTTVLSTYFGDLFLAASCIFGFGYQRDFGAQSDDPRTAQSWEQQYNSLLKGAQLEEARKKFQSAGWTSKSTPALATPGF